MAENKKSFLLYADLINTVDELDDSEAGILFKHILKYVNDLNPECPDKITKIAFEPVKLQLKRDLQKWEDSKDKFSKAGKASAFSRNLSKEQFYILRMYNETEEFLKIGITDNSIGRRYSSSGNGSGNLKYKFEILYQMFYENGNKKPIEIEEEINLKFKHVKHIPKIYFPGHTECYKIQYIDDIVHHVKSFNNVEVCSTNPTVTDNVTVTVNVTDNVIKDEVAPPPIITSISIQDDRANANHAFSDEKFHYLCHQKGLTERQIVGEIMTLFLTHRSGNAFPESNSRDFRQHFFNWIGKGGHTHLMTKISTKIQNTEHNVPKADPAAIQAKYGRRN